MNLKKTKTCEGCRALVGKSFLGLKCELGFKVSARQISALGLTVISPAEPCYKPKTINQYFEAIEARRNTVAFDSTFNPQPLTK